MATTISDFCVFVHDMEQKKCILDELLEEHGEGFGEDATGRTRCFSLLLYPEHENTGLHKTIIEQTLYDLDWNFCGRVHDQDDGVRLHHHVVVTFKDGRKREDVARDLGMVDDDGKPNITFVRRWHSYKKAMRYLCHADNPDRFQYDTTGIYGTLADKAIAECRKNTKSEAEGVFQLYDFINKCDEYLTVTTVFKYALDNDLYSHYRRMGNHSFKLIEEHNARIAARESEEERKKPREWFGGSSE